MTKGHPLLECVRLPRAMVMHVYAGPAWEVMEAVPARRQLRLSGFL